jgi:hypothetical protein
MTTNNATTNVPLGTLIFRAGLLTEAQLEQALADSIKRGQRLGQVLVEQGLLKETDIARILAGQRGLEFVSLADRPIDPAAAEVIPHEAASLNHAVPIGFADGVPVIAVDDPSDEVVIRNVRALVGGDVRFVVATRSEILDVLSPRQEIAPPAQEAGIPPVESTASNGVVDQEAACRVVVRLANGEHIEAGDFASVDRATEEARCVIRRLATSTSSDWPLFDGRFVRPESVVSVDLVPAALE